MEFQNETHQGIKCNICNIEPIKGLRYKCSECFDFNLCTLCKNKATHGHQITHSMITHGKTVSNEIDFSKVKLENRLGDGAFGDVFKAVYENKTVACKIISTQKIKLRNITLDSSHFDEMLKSYKRELNAYNEIKGDNILRMIGQCSIQNNNTFKFVLLTELMGKGSLEKLIYNEPELTNRKRFTIAAGIASGMAYIHKLGFIHRDIRPANILVSSNYVPKIGDMGIARVFEESGNNKATLIGCAQYMPLEFYTGKYDKKLDVYTFGLTLNELFKGKHSAFNKRIEIVKPCETIYYKLVSNFIDNEPDNRPNSKSIDEMISFINSYITSEIEKDREHIKIY